MEYMTKKVPRDADEVLKYVQAHYQLEKGRRVSEAEVIYLTLRHYAEERYGYSKNAQKKGLGITHLFGSVKGGSRSSWKEIDKVVYGA